MSEGGSRVDYWSSIVTVLNQRYADALVPEVETFLKGVRNGRVLVACSGGADSVFLLLMLVSRRNALGTDLVVAHYNHRWRGDTSDADAAFVESLADALGLPFVSASRPNNEAAFTETTARALRLEFLRQAALQNQCRCIAFGHQMDDVLETQLQRIARGSGTDGLAAPRPIAKFPNLPTHVRPLLNMRSVDLRMALNGAGVVWREDDSNDDLSIARNALRQKVIPDFCKVLDRDPVVGAARCRRLMEEDAIALDQLTREQLPEAFGEKTSLSRSDFKSSPRGLTRRALMAWLNRNELLASVGAPALDLLINEIYGVKKRHRVSAGQSYIVIDPDFVKIERAAEASSQPIWQDSLTLEPNTPLILPTGAILELTVVDLGAQIKEAIFNGLVEPEETAYLSLSPDVLFSVRGWMPGDRFLPLGAPGSKKLQDWFIDRHIPQTERKQLPIVTNSSGEIVWVPGFPPADRMRIRRNAKQALRLTYRKRNPPSLA